jgi:hypothetical protein
MKYYTISQGPQILSPPIYYRETQGPRIYSTPNFYLDMASVPLQKFYETYYKGPTKLFVMDNRLKRKMYI